MAGLRKQKKYNWKETNLAYFGSELEKQIKKASAECEDAWKGAGTKVGLQVWRIVKFKVTHWPKSDYGKFYDGDSYIILNTYKKDPSSEALAWDVHFWIGKYSTQDEYGTAAYKTVELDHFLNDAAVQHREVQGHESKLFRSYFSKIVLWKGGAESGFKHVEPEKYEPRLLHFKGLRDNVMIEEVKLRRKYLNSGDVFILDLGLDLIQWNGKESNKDERAKAAEFMLSIKSDRGGRPQLRTVDEEGLPETDLFYQKVPPGLFESKKVKSAKRGGEDSEVQKYEKELFRIREGRHQHDLTFKSVAKGTISKGYLDPTDVFVLDTGFHVFVWVGKEASSHEKGGGLMLAHEYVNKHKQHPFLPVTRVAQGQHNLQFEAAFDDNAPIGSKSTEKGDCIIL